jgi:hypothetical protein
MHALDRRDPRDAARLKPIEEFSCRARVGAARVRVPDLRGEELSARRRIGSVSLSVQAGTFHRE